MIEALSIAMAFLAGFAAGGHLLIWALGKQVNALSDLISTQNDLLQAMAEALTND